MRIWRPGMWKLLMALACEQYMHARTFVIDVDASRRYIWSLIGLTAVQINDVWLQLYYCTDMRTLGEGDRSFTAPFI